VHSKAGLTSHNAIPAGAADAMLQALHSFTHAMPTSHVVAASKAAHAAA
jgi:hypothetical protein